MSFASKELLVHFIPLAKLGIMAEVVASLQSEPNKRKRQIAFKELTNTLSSLRILPKGSAIFLGLGLNAHGERGLLVGGVPTAGAMVRTAVQLPTGESNVDQH